jgi:hypothetical protein
MGKQKVTGIASRMNEHMFLLVWVDNRAWFGKADFSEELIKEGDKVEGFINSSNFVITTVLSNDSCNLSNYKEIA